MSQNSQSPFGSSNSDEAKCPSSADPSPVNDLFRANQEINWANGQNIAPALGLSALPAYKASGRIGPLGWPLLIFSLFLVPILGALIFEKGWHLGNMLIFSHIVLGVLVVLALYPAIQFGKVRNVAVAAIIGGLIGAATAAGAMGLEAWSYRPQFVADDTAYLVKTRGVQPQKAAAAVEAHYTPINMTRVYWEERANAGMALHCSGSLTSTQVNGSMFWVIQGMEFLLVTLGGAGLGAYFAARRYSDEFDCWYRFKHIGTVHPMQFKTFLDAAIDDDWNRAATFVTRGKNDGPSAASLCVSHLPQKPGGLLTVQAKTAKNKGPQTVFAQELSDGQIKAVWPAYPSQASASQPFSGG